jgi:hypothetical protein
MTQLLPSSSQDEPKTAASTEQEGVPYGVRTLDLKVQWGSDYYRLEYLIHLLDTGRVKDAGWKRPV